MAEKYFLRGITLKDITKTYEWAYGDQTLPPSPNAEHLDFETYKKWFEKVLHAPNILIYILTDGAEDFGQICFKMDNDDKATIRYGLSPAHRGKGLEQLIVNLGILRFLKGFPRINNIEAVVKKSNISSQIMFRKLGFKEYLIPGEEIYKYTVLRDAFAEVHLNYQSMEHGVLLLTNNRNAFALYEKLCHLNETVTVFSDKITDVVVKNMSPKIIVSYNYAHIIRDDVIKQADAPIVNIHISLLPWNRGADPNFWSFVENTPKGVTIHRIDAGLDTGDILLQQEIIFDETIETFRTSYEKLQSIGAAMLVDNWHDLVNDHIVGAKQVGPGSYHTRKDFNEFVKGNTFNWDMNIACFKRSFR